MSESSSRLPVPPSEDLAPGDILRSRYGRTVRTVVEIKGGKAVLLARNGSIERIPLNCIDRFWRKERVKKK